MITLIYGAIAIAFLILVMGLLRKPQPPGFDEDFTEKGPARSIGNTRWLYLSERLFDPSDARWLAEELAFPSLARSLELGRKQLAIRWLETLRTSFDDLVRTHELISSEASVATPASSWQMLWLTVRFKLLVSYALLVVKLFGPYQRLIPSFSWVSLPQRNDPSVRRPALADSRSSR